MLIFLFFGGGGRGGSGHALISVFGNVVSVSCLVYYFEYYLFPANYVGYQCELNFFPVFIISVNFCCLQFFLLQCLKRFVVDI